MAESDRSAARRFRLLGLGALVLAIVGALALWSVAGRRYDDAVEGLAPAPIGCDTTLVFDRQGTYTFFVETRGRVGDIEGDCDNDDRAYDVDGEAPPVELTLVNAEGAEIDLDRADGPSYDRAGFMGTGVRTVDIEVEGDYVLRATSDVQDVMVRVGRDPANGVTAMRLGAGAVLLAGIVLAVLAFWKGRSQWTIPAEPSGPAEAPWEPLRPLVPPVAPPYANRPIPPPYAPPRPRPLPPPTPPPPPHRPG